MKQSYTLLIQFLIALTLSASLTAQNEFITTWKTDNPGTSNATSITIPTAASGYNYDVDWENDGTWDDFGVTGDITHDYGIIGTRTVAIRGTFPRIYFNNSGDRQKLLEVNQWGTIAWSTMTRAFAGCENLKISAPDAPNLTFVTNLIQMFQNATYLLGDISGWNVSNITNMSNMFDNATFFDGDLSSWDVSAVTNMNNMLRNVTLSTTNYENILIGWNSQTLQNGVSFHGGNSQYCSVAATNARANIMASDSWTITDGGTIPPTAACIVTPFTLYLNASGNATLDPNDVDNGSILNCAGTLDLSLSKTAFTCANLGSNSVTLTVDDGNGNTDTCTATVEVVDNINPTASNPVDINVQCLGDVPATDITVVMDEADNCGTPTVAFVSQTANPAINNGTITRTYSVTDASGNSIDVYQDINILDNTDPTASNPADINVQCLGDVPATDITVVMDGADNCGTPTVAFVSQTANPAINNGTITRTYSVTDASGNSIDVYQDIIINDNTDPTASNPADINVQCLGDVPAADITVVTDEADNCGTPTVAFVSQTANPAINNGTITRTYSVTDASGNSINVTQDINILDNTDPTASNPADINVQCLGDVPAVDITVVTDEADNCGTPTVAFVSQTANPAINNGTITRTYSVTDASGNSINVTQDINILDNTDPTASNPADINVQCLGDVPAVDITVVTDEADNCGTPTVAFVSQTANPAINNGTITRTYSVTDASGNSINVTQDINILDNTDPTASNPADINVQCLGDVPAADITVVTDEADNCGTPTVAFVSQTANPAINNGTITRTYSVTDASGNSINVTQDINILDNTDPTASNPADINVQCLGDVPAADITVVTDEADNCGTPTVAFVSQTANPAINNGTITRTYSVTDASGNSINVTQDINILDNTDPTASNPADINVQCLGDVPAVDITVVTDEADNCGTPTVAFVSQTANPAINNGTITRTYSVTDASGNSINVTQDINILDNTDPTASNPADINVQCLGDVPAADITVVTDEADNCGTPTVAFVSQTANPAINNGTITRTYSVTDASGNSINVTQDINILDNTDPTASNPADINVQCLGDVPAVNVNVVTDEADNCGIPTVAFVSQTANPAINNGTITRTYSVTDASGNSINVTQDINILDNTDPTASNPADINVQCLGDVPAVNVNVVTDEADNCGIPTVAFVSQTANPAINNGTITRTYSVTDASGNSINVTQDINILDNTDPTASNLAPVNVQCASDVPAVNIADVNDEADNCAGTITVAHVSDVSDANFNPEIITRTYSVTDASGNSINVTQLITIEDTTNPTASNLTPLSVQCPSDVPPANIALVNDETDNCIGTITVAHIGDVSNGSFNPEIITRTYSVTDASGNSINVTQLITIEDTTNPTASNLTPLSVQCPSDVPPANIALVNDETDNCIGTITVAHIGDVSNGSFNPEIITRTYSVTDASGNSRNVTQLITIEDNTNPTAVCQNYTITLDATGNASIINTDIDNGSSDNCAISSMSLDIYNFDCDDLGANTVTLTVYDASGNSDTCTATVTVLDPGAASSVTIASNDANNEICLGENVTFTATPVNAGTTQFYEWFIDGVSEGITAVSTFTPVPAPIADYTIYVEMTTDLSACDPKVSNILSIVVHPLPIVSVSDYDICIDDNTQSASPSTGGTWTSNNVSVATIDNSGAITPQSDGTVTFTFTSSTTDCSTTTNTVTINPLPIIGNYPTDNEICENETHTLFPSSGGTWTSSNNAIATITNGGVITGISPGNVNFLFTNTTTGCSNSSTSIEVLEAPVITSVTVSDSPICAGDPSVLTANVFGASLTAETIVNYDFNTGNSYGSLVDISTTPNINSNFFSPSGGNNIPFKTRSPTAIATNGGPFTINTPAGNSLMQEDDWQDGGWYGGSDDSGMWRLNVNGSNLVNYQNFRFGFQFRRGTRFGDTKNILVEYRSGNSGPWSSTNVVVSRSNAAYVNRWQTANIALPASFDNPSLLQFRLRVDDGSTYNSGWGGVYDQTEPHVYIDNLQVQGSSAGNAFAYSWSSNTGVDAGLPAAATTPSINNNQITVNPEVTTQYTVTVTNNDECPTTETVTVNVFPSPDIIIITDYCPSDVPSTPQDESNMVQLVATANQPITSWEWNTGETGDTIYVDVAGQYQVIGTTANGCSDGDTINVSQELVINGDFSAPRQTVDGPFPDNMAALGFDFDSGYNYHANPTLYQNRLTVTSDVEPFYPGIFRSVPDHTGDGAGQYLAVNGDVLALAAWRQVITVEPNTDYYFSAWGIDISDTCGGCYLLVPSDLRFRINGTDIGSTLDLVKGDDWKRFYGVWNSGSNTTATVEIRNVVGDLNGNNFAIDDVSFATLSTFINQTSAPGTENQTVCQNTPITDVSFKVGGGLTGPSITGLPAGLATSFDGLEYIISGNPTEFGTFNYTISTNASCGNKTFSGTIIVNPEPLVTITTTPDTVCASNGTIALSATLSGSATGGTWSISGTPITTTVTGNVASATYTIATTGLTTFTFTSNDPSGPCDEAIETIDFNITPYIIADAGSNQTTAGCAATTVTLSANNVTGFWTALPDTGYFDNDTAYNSNFTGESGTVYTLTWTATNASPCGNTTDSVTITIPDCGTSLVFDGGDDYINFGDNYNLNNTNFSIEAWIKTNNTSDTNTIISKRNGTSTASGYDLSLVGNRLYFRYNDSEIISNQTLNSSKWYHIAVTFSGTSYTLYIDGFPVRTIAGTTPDANTNKALVGATDRTDDSPINYFDGKIDEIRIWDIELSQAQIREMMNQEIKQDGSNVIGEVIPIEITGNLQWNNLIGYYQMSTGPQTNIVAGTINDISTVSINPGKLNAMTIIQVEDAPIPYISRLDDAWDNETTWSASSVQQIPNSKTNNVVPNNLQTWNIVRTATNVSTNRSTASPQLGKTTLHGLLVDSNTLSIESDQPLQVNKYLKIDGTLDLEGESQLLQPMGSIVDYAGTGKLERDQQGTGNEFNYNYWGSPVSNAGSAANRTYALASILYDGITPVSWTTNNDAPGTNPATISSRWLYTYANLTGAYADWNRINQNFGINVGLGFTMKGSGNGASEQNYTFAGQPNNGTLTHTIGANNETLLGNPYPSAIDAITFISDNQPALLDGKIIFWEQAPNNPSHILSDYRGRYSYLNNIGGLASTSSPSEIDDAGNTSKIPGRYVPVGQGFFVKADADGGTLIFNNAQRVFKKEGTQSVFLRPSDDNQDYVNLPNGEESVIRRLRFNFITPEGAIRHLLLGFTSDNAATDGVDYGYDALNSDDFPSDLTFIIEGNDYVIQGVGEFDDTKVYPLNMVIGEQGNIEIGLTELENFEESIDVYIFDAVEGSYTRFNDVNFQLNLEAGQYNDRFYLVFQENAVLSTIEEEFKDISVRYLHDSEEINVKTPLSVEVNQLYLINVAGQTVASWNATNLPMSHDIKIPVKHISEGAYIIKAETETATFSKKIIIKYNR